MRLVVMGALDLVPGLLGGGLAVVGLEATGDTVTGVSDGLLDLVLGGLGRVRSELLLSLYKKSLAKLVPTRGLPEALDKSDITYSERSPCGRCQTCLRFVCGDCLKIEMRSGIFDYVLEVLNCCWRWKLDGG